LEYGSIGIGKSRVFEMEGRDKSSNTAVVINTIAISWEDPNDGTSFVPNSNTNCKDLYPVTGNPGWSYTGMLRAQIIPVDSFTLNRSSLANLSGTVFLCPNSANSGTSPGSVSYPDISGTEKNGPMVNGNCNVGAKPTQPRYCNAQITGLAMLQSKTYFLDLRSIYTPTRVTVRAYGTDGIDVTNQLNIAEAQTLVDSTGKAQDVLKRIQVRVPTHNSYAIPDGTSATDTICKQLTIQPGNGTAGCSP
jgi:hypothetical protein